MVVIIVSHFKSLISSIVNEKICYKCGKPATSREHVPPKCFFPEKKDVGHDGFRKNLITVPSCDEHNYQKSDDDEFLLASVAAVLNNNSVGFNHNQSKVKRAMQKSRA